MTKVVAVSDPVASIKADALVVFIPSDEELTGVAADIDAATGGLIAKLLEREDFAGKALETLVAPAPDGLIAQRLVLCGLGPTSGVNARIAYRAASAAAKSLSKSARAMVVFAGHPSLDAWVADGIAGAMNGCVGQDVLRSELRLHPFGEIGWVAADPAQIQRGSYLGEAVRTTRRLVNLPAGDMYPESFADASRQVAAQCGLECEVWDEDRLEQERCGALLAVGRASERPPRLVLLRHQGAGDGAPWTALAGKGVTFDSGGLSLKPNDSMLTMKCDMAGAATVVGAMQALANLKAPVNVLGLCGLAENMVSGRSFKLGDVLRSRAGKTIEVLNTDAEGRLVLADVLNIAVEQQVERIIDLATLTGACVVALGTDIAGLMSNHSDLEESVRASAEACGERVWPLPMHSDFSEQLRSDVADIKNVGAGRWGGAITAAKFLEAFVEETPWAHLDIAGPAFLDRSTSWSDGGATGALVRTLVACVERNTPLN